MENEIAWRLRDAPLPDKQMKLPATGTLKIGREQTADIVLPDTTVSRHHATLTISDSQIEVEDANSANGTYLDGRPVEKVKWFAGEKLQIGPYVLDIVSGPLSRLRRPPAITETVFPPPFFDQPVVSLAELRRVGNIAAEVDYLALGGGLGSFTWVDHLRIFGVRKQDIRAIGVDPAPYAKYKRLCLYSQIPDRERLRSNSISTPDNIWGFPGYASRETVRDIFRGRVGGIKYILQVFGEPALCPSYTPRAGDVYRSIDREANRIGWSDIWIPGRILKVRKTDDGRYAVAYRVPREFHDGRSERNRFVIAKCIHLALGYPASRFLDDLQEFKRREPQAQRVVNAYEHHDEIYDELAKNGGTVVVRGRGIVASRILQRLSEARASNKNIRVLHVMRGPIQTGRKYDLARRHAQHDIEFQPFNWPKAAWGGTLRRRLERLPPEKRFELMDKWGGTTTADRPDWNEIIEDGKREGWYRPYFGDVTQMSLDKGAIVTRLHSSGAFSEDATLRADYVIDCTGLIADLTANPVLDDLIRTYALKRNVAARRPQGDQLTGLHVGNDFQVEGLRNGDGHAFASGVMTVNGPYAAVDSFLGLQYAALRSVDSLRQQGAPGISSFTPFRSFRQWLKWCAGISP